jgi:hypothetical protein
MWHRVVWVESNHPTWRHDTAGSGRQSPPPTPRFDMESPMVSRRHGMIHTMHSSYWCVALAGNFREWSQSSLSMSSSQHPPATHPATLRKTHQEVMAFPSLRQPKSIKNMSRGDWFELNKMEMVRIPSWLYIHGIAKRPTQRLSFYVENLEAMACLLRWFTKFHGGFPSNMLHDQRCTWHMIRFRMVPGESPRENLGTDIIGWPSFDKSYNPISRGHFLCQNSIYFHMFDVSQPFSDANLFIGVPSESANFGGK